MGSNKALPNAKLRGILFEFQVNAKFYFSGYELYYTINDYCDKNNVAHKHTSLFKICPEQKGLPLVM